MCVWWNKCTDSVTEKHKFDANYTQIWQRKNTCAMKRIHVFNNVEMRVRWNGNTYLMTWIYIFGYAKIRAQWIGPLRLTECSQPISWVNATNSPNVRCGIPIRATHYYNIYNTSSQTVRNIIVTRLQLVYFVIVTHSENKNPLFAFQKPYFCTPKTPFLACKKGVFAL